MAHRVGIRREDKSVWERRVPLTPGDARMLWEREGVEVRVRPSPTRVITAEEFREAGVMVDEDLSSCPVILGVVVPEIYEPVLDELESMGIHFSETWETVA